MYANYILPFLALLAPSVYSLPAFTTTTVGPVIGEWTVYGFYRDCTREANSCDYHFIIDENTNSKDVAECKFSVKGHGETDFRDKHCGERFRVNGGWAQRGTGDSFVTVVVTDVEKGAYGFFGFRADEFERVGSSKPSSTKPAYKIE
ncbi:hypothetical protein OQA88_13607 [Cercophora sp. LCS_1]